MKLFILNKIVTDECFASVDSYLMSDWVISAKDAPKPEPKAVAVNTQYLWAKFPYEFDPGPKVNAWYTYIINNLANLRETIETLLKEKWKSTIEK